jgi:hypothetical protein
VIVGHELRAVGYAPQRLGLEAGAAIIEPRLAMPIEEGVDIARKL